MTKQSLKTIAAAIATLIAPAILAAAQTSEAPRAVSPGSPVAAETLAGSCPTFSWSGVAGAHGYELVVYRVTESDALETALQTQVAGDARSWSPSATQCPASDSPSGNQYAWAVRALTEDGTGAWSEPLLFTTPGAPSEDEVRQALDTLRRYRQDREEAVGEGLAPSRPPNARRHPTGEPAGPPTTDDQESTATLSGADIEALSLPTLGATPSPQTVTAPSSFSLNLSGDVELGGFVFKDGAPFIHNDGGIPGRNTAVGLNALVSATPGSPSGDSGSTNSAFGFSALSANTSGFGNTASGFQALASNTEGFFNTASGDRALALNTTGTRNTASGFQTLFFNTTGSRNTASGSRALFANTTGSRNTASGFQALYSNTTGQLNTASGDRALYSNTTGQLNTASGDLALYSNTTGTRNTASGDRALFNNTTGWRNTAIGYEAGFNWTTGENNIALGRGTFGTAGESGVIRIGGDNFQSQTFIEGISNASGTFSTAVCINGDQLGPCSASSKRFKRDVKPLGDLHRALSALEPVSFRYKKEFAGEEDPPVQYGFIAEEVAKTFPSLVTYDDDGRAHTVRYDLLTPLLLGEIQRQEGELARQDHDLADLRRQMADRDRDYRQTNAELKRRLDKLAKKKRFR